MWFTLFHEAGHLLLHSRAASFLDDGRGSSSELEQQADQFAADTLIPPRAYDAFLRASGHFSIARVLTFARSIEVAPGVVVGRLQHDTHVARSHLNGLKRRYMWNIHPE